MKELYNIWCPGCGSRLVPVGKEEFFYSESKKNKTPDRVMRCVSCNHDNSTGGVIICNYKRYLEKQMEMF